MRYILSFVGYGVITLAIYIIGKETQSQFFAILYWLLLALPVFNLFRAISWAVHFYFTDKKDRKSLLFRYFLNTFIPKGFVYNLKESIRKENEPYPTEIIIFFISLIAYFIKQATDWLLFSILFWITFILTLSFILITYHESGEEELGNDAYDESMGLFKILGFCLAFWIFFIGVINFKTIKDDTMPQYVEALADFSKERIAEMLTPPRGHHSSDDDEEPYFRGHLGRE